MTDQQHPITPSIELVSQWTEGWNPNDEFMIEHVARQAARWGWQQRDASVPGELQEARDEELDACCEHISDWYEAPEFRVAQLRAARRPKPKNLAEEALLAIDTAVADDRLSPAVAHAVRRALERLQELEGQSDD